MPVLAQRIADLTERIYELSELSGISPDELRAYFTSDPLSPEGRAAQKKVKELAEGFLGDMNVRRALVLEPARIYAEYKMTELLLSWGSEKPEEYARNGIPQEEYDRLAAIEEEARRKTDPESVGFTRVIQEKSIVAIRLSGWLGDLIQRDKGLTLEGAVCSFIRESKYRPAIQIVFTNRFRTMDQSWWASIERARRIIQLFPELRGPRMVEEYIVSRLADAMVEEARRFAERDPSTERCVVELITELARMTESYRLTRQLFSELGQSIQNVVDTSWNLLGPLAMLQAAIKALNE